jgi:hypothetical protein
MKSDACQAVGPVIVWVAINPILNFLYHSVIREKLTSNAKAGNITKGNFPLINLQADEVLSISARNPKNPVWLKIIWTYSVCVLNV